MSAKCLALADLTKTLVRTVKCVEGRDLGTNLTILTFTSTEVGDGPVLHVHKYDEVFLIHEGAARFTVGDEEIIAEAGHVVLGPANVPHKFENLGPSRLTTTDIHLSDHFEQVNLE